MARGIDYRRAGDLDRATRLPDEREPINGLLARITGATAISSGSGGYRWLYSWSEAQVGTAPTYVSAVKSGGISGNAISVSELGNSATHVAYGVQLSNIPTGYAPVQIPTNTAVWIVPHRQSDGNLLWLIVNTQAIDGNCP